MSPTTQTIAVGATPTRLTPAATTAAGLSVAITNTGASTVSIGDSSVTAGGGYQLGVGQSIALVIDTTGQSDTRLSNFPVVHEPDGSILAGQGGAPVSQPWSLTGVLWGVCASSGQVSVITNPGTDGIALGGGGGAPVNDTTTSTGSVWSSAKTAASFAPLVGSRGLSAFRGLVPVAARGAQPSSSFQQAASSLGGTSRYFVPVHDQSAAAIAVLPFWGNMNGGDTPNTNPITLAACVEDGSTLRDFHFNGQHTVQLAGGALAIPDEPIYVPLVTLTYATGAGTGTVKGFWMRNYVGISAGQQYPISHSTGIVTGEVIGESAAGGADLTIPGSGSVTAGGLGVGLGPMGFLGPRPVSRLCVWYGDSISNGQADTPGYYGWVDRAAVATGVPMLKVGRGGEQAGSFASTSSRSRRGAWLAGATDVFIAYGANDLKLKARTVTQLQADLTTLYGWARSQGARVHGVTITPLTASSDSWATTGNQTADGVTGTSSLASDIATVNDWIRGHPAGMYGHVELADAVMSAHNSGLWAAGGLTSDGIHPKPSTYQTIMAPLLAAYLSALPTP